MPTMWLSDNQSKKRLLCTLRTKAFPGHWLTHVLSTTEIGVIFCSAAWRWEMYAILNYPTPMRYVETPTNPLHRRSSSSSASP
ncbi:hypothetical protein An14g03170 [Aspergillus niger]|uniref:Uncharacterized protein n=2 Tax=Aspergillus niger TaxID=5061 RepID=A2R362_ASPNC|nr:hypothetical protein An14g03170 [Aspergillus niger]CAK46554.1 hypothetical protein An14g03170 [Aspergillus niger]